MFLFRKQKTVDQIVAVFTDTLAQLDKRSDVLLQEVEQHRNIIRENTNQIEIKKKEATRAQAVADKIKTIFEV